MLYKLQTFKTYRKNLISKYSNFKRDRKKLIVDKKYNYNYAELLKKIGNADTATCYLTGRTLDLKNGNSYHFDHIIPFSKGGESTLDNLGIVCAEANKAKSDLLLEDFINLCKEILIYNGYEVIKNENQIL